MSWRRLRALLRREVRATFRDAFTVGALVAVPTGALLLFGWVLATDVKHLAFGVLDASDSPASRRLVRDVAASRAFDVRRFTTRERLEHALVAGQVSAGLVIPPDFARDLDAAARGGPPPEVQALYDAGEAVVAGNAEGFLRSLVEATGASLVARRRGAPPNGVQVVTRALFNPRLDGAPFMVSGTFGFVLSFLTTLITAVSIVNERLAGTFEQLQVTPATSVEILLGKILPLGAIFALDIVLLMLIAGFVFGVWPAGSAVFFFVVSAFYMLISLALGLIFSATSRTAAEAVQKTVLFSIPLVQLSGFAFPVRNMPLLLRWIADVFPATHYIHVSHAVYIRGEGPVTLFPHLLYLLLVGVVLIALAIRSIESRT